MTDRFHPVTAGIIGLWDYDEQQFDFADGHLVLRGPNGSGKTKALELLFPLVIDGSLDPHRLDPFSGRHRTMRDNLLYGERKLGHGYVWMTFARGEERVTVGLGLQAQAQAQPSDVRRWFFVAEGAVGDGIALLDDSRRPLEERALRQQLGEEHVYKTRDAHRRAVDGRLFSLGEERYEAMLELIVALRRPQLAKELDPVSLSVVLSEGLRTVDPELLRTSAQAFDDLEEAQRRLTALERAERAVGETRTAWRSYLRARAALRVAEVTEHRGRRDRALRERAECALHIERFTRAERAAEARRQQAEDRVRLAGERLEALRASAAYRDQGQLEDARQTLHLADRNRDRAAAEEARSGTEHRHTQALQAQAEERAGRAREQQEAARRSLHTHADSAGLDADGPLREQLVAREADVAAVRERLAALERAAELQGERARAHQQALSAREQAAAQLSALEADREQARGQLLKALTPWHAGLPEALRREEDLRELRAAIEATEGAPGLRADLRSRWEPLRDEARDAEREARAEAERQRERLGELAASIEAIASEREDGPPVPHHRRASREERPGAPLWRLVRFREEVEEDAQAGLEGALLAAGLLDAWVDPEGVSAEPLREDSALTPAPLEGRRTLAELLEVEAQDAVAPARVEAALRSLSLDEGALSARTDGYFRLGPLSGAHRPARARYLGATARERHRAERIAALREEERLARSALEAAEQAGAEAQSLLDALASGLRALPSETSLERAARAVEGGRGQLRQADATELSAATALSEAKRARSEAERHLRTEARERQLPEGRAPLEALSAALGATRSALEALDKVRAETDRAEERARDALAAAQHAEVRHRTASEALREARQERDARAARLRVLEATLGVEVREVLTQLKEAEVEQAAARAEEREAAEARSDATGSVRTQQGALLQIERRLPDLETDLARALRALLPLQRPALLQLLEVPQGEAPLEERLAAAVTGASTTEERLRATETALSNLLNTLDEGLGERAHSVRHTEDELTLISVRDEGGEHDLVSYALRLSQDLSAARELLADSERQLFEAQLLQTLSGQLRERIAQARKLVRAMDDTMRARRLASGKSVGIAWKTGEVDAQRQELLRLLEVDPTLLGDERRGRLREALRQEVQGARAERPDRSYQEILEEALDYRRWHRFELSLHEPDGSRRELTRATHAKLSGGEKAAAVHLPLFAAAQAHLSAGASTAPRLIALDEAFAGIDSTGVPELLRLAGAFDLDWFLTGHDLWVTEPSVGSVMHYDLAHDPVGHAVSAWPVRWDGAALVEGR